MKNMNQHGESPGGILFLPALKPAEGLAPCEFASLTRCLAMAVPTSQKPSRNAKR